MKSIVLELQAMASSSDTSVSDLLRKAKVVATKLDLPEMLEWVDNELTGYPADSETHLPEYRYIAGEVKAWNPVRGWMPIVFDSNEVYDLLSKRGISQSVGELDAIMATTKDDGSLYVDFAPIAKKTICEAIDFNTDIKFHTNISAVAGILSGIKNVVLDWSLRLEKMGILGEDMTFSKEEKEKVHESSTIFNIENFAGTIGDVKDNANITINQINQANEKEIKDFLDQLEKFKSELSLTDVKNFELEDNVEKIKSELEGGSPKVDVVHQGLLSIRRIVEGASGNLVAQGIISSIGKLLTQV